MDAISILDASNGPPVQYALDTNANQVNALSPFLLTSDVIVPPDSLTGYTRSSPPLVRTILDPSGGSLILIISACDVGDAFNDSGFLLRAEGCVDCDFGSDEVEINYVYSTTTLPPGEQLYTSTVPALDTVSGTFIVFVEPTGVTTTTNKATTTADETTTTDNLTTTGVGVTTTTEVYDNHQDFNYRDHNHAVDELTTTEMVSTTEQTTSVFLETTTATADVTTKSVTTTDETTTTKQSTTIITSELGTTTAEEASTSTEEVTTSAESPSSTDVELIPTTTSEAASTSVDQGPVLASDTTTSQSIVPTTDILIEPTTTSTSESSIVIPEISSESTASSTVSTILPLPCFESASFAEENTTATSAAASEVIPETTSIPVEPVTSSSPEIPTTAPSDAPPATSSPVDGPSSIDTIRDSSNFCGGLVVSSSDRRSVGPRKALGRRAAPANILSTLYALDDEPPSPGVTSTEVEVPVTTQAGVTAIPINAISSRPVATVTDIVTESVVIQPVETVINSGTERGHTLVQNTVTTVAYTIVDPNNPSVMTVTEYCATLSYEPCSRCAHPPVPTVEMTTYVVPCNACGHHGENEVTITAPCANTTETARNAAHGSQDLVDAFTPTRAAYHAVPGPVRTVTKALRHAKPTAGAGSDHIESTSPSQYQSNDEKNTYLGSGHAVLHSLLGPSLTTPQCWKLSLRKLGATNEVLWAHPQWSSLLWAFSCSYSGHAF
ncbi:hypothetical protein FPHYL_5917 [Fusarium phyllophilum]|uniref:Uncharacterized protein n=1 Tax=Fusarium phyllophilum TaxID=47803 RepID=A0A8H5JWA7_9HYPO|nr:hypothetical protein FPHYL_5917 [Fusarium phyllophilum]